MTEINTYNNLSVDIIEVWIDGEIEYLEKQTNTWDNVAKEQFSHIGTHSAMLFARRIVVLDTLRDLKRSLHNVDLMKECKKTDVKEKSK